MSSIVSEITDWLASAGFGTEGVDLYIGHLIPDPDNVLMLFASGGSEQSGYLDTAEALVDIWSRNRSSEVAYDKLNQIFETLHRQQNILLSRYYVYAAQATTNIMDLDRDDNGRKLFKQTYRIIYRDTNLVS